MYRAFLLVLCLPCLFACSADDDSGTPAGQPIVEERSSESTGENDPDFSGREAYNDVCARCHETGVNGAPVTGNRADWQGRSQLWQAVLMEHAKAGYFDMPAKGGDSELSDRMVDAATEYMLTITFPDRLPD